MTRKDALEKAIQILKNTDMAPAEKQEIVQALELCCTELPFARWTEAAIFDACDQYCKEAGRPYLLASDFQKAALPSHTTIRNRFGMTVAQFRDTYYPIHRNPMSRKGIHLRYNGKSEEEYLQDFTEWYSAVHPESAVVYDRIKPEDAPGHQTLQRMAKVSGWKALLEKLGLQEKEQRRIMVRYSGSEALQYLREMSANQGISE